MLEYKGFKISGSSTPMYMEGKIFKTMKEAEAHGLELAREWVDNPTKPSFSF